MDIGSTTLARVIDYKKSWVRALPRIMLGFAIVPLSSILVSVSLVVITSRLVSLVLNVIVLVTAASVYVRPTVDRAATIELKTVLKVGQVTPAKI